MIPCIVLVGPIGLCFGYMSAEGNNILPSVSLVFSSMLIIASVEFLYLVELRSVFFYSHSALEKRLLYDSIIMDEHFKGQRCACGYFLTPSSSSPCCCLQQLIWPLYTLPLLLIFVFHLLFLVLLLVSHGICCALPFLTLVTSEAFFLRNISMISLFLP
ncbi:uncharacterized protein LOC114260431 isoform X7 [Camellia sinensis]|uniref:uncharacterized protein LOC114260431 isoform X7 n=1 Tax=Camellia sinensis TaxID=4442 RepID=UPI001036E922|nr:uncharacterized protein LOC114260431 isoform X7 [Camellia sinensis]